MEMEPGAYVVTVVVALLAFGLVALRFRQASGRPFVVSSRADDRAPEIDVPAAFTNTGTEGSSAFTSPGTARTPEPDVNAPVQDDGPDFAAIAASMERYGYLCLSRADQETARQLVYQIERQARFEPGGQRSKSDAIERATGQKRGGSVGYKRASAIYDAVVGKPDPAVVAPVLARGDEVLN